MVYRPQIDPSLCFVVMPYGAAFDPYYESSIKPAIEAAGMRAERGDENRGASATIVHDIWKSIWKARLVVGDVTGKNPNVNYELGLCHALGVPTIIITQNRDDVPFDLLHLRHFLYNNDPAGLERMRMALQTNIEAALREVLVSDLLWPYDASPAPGVQDGIQRLQQHLPFQNLLSTGLILPLGSADTHLLQLILTDGRLNRNDQGGANLYVHFDEDTPAIWRREAKGAIKQAIPDFVKKAEERQAQIDSILFESHSGPVRFADSDFPFRYANGGVLPIVQMNGHPYYCLFYRDTEPVGWNIANGGSDSRDELLDPTEIVEREFREELLIFNREKGVRYAFQRGTGAPPDRPENSGAWKLWSELLAKRAKGEGLDLQEFATEMIPVRWSSGPDTIRVQPSVGEPVDLANFYLNINAGDCGIEVDRIAVIDVPGGAQLLDGEVYDNKLLNRPIGLFRVDRFGEELDVKAGHEFRPDMVLYYGEPARLEVTDEFVRRQVSNGLAPPDHFEFWSERVPCRFDLCPVTRSIIRRHQTMRAARQ